MDKNLIESKDGVSIPLLLIVITFLTFAYFLLNTRLSHKDAMDLDTQLSGD